jgi:acyl carrier protein
MTAIEAHARAEKVFQNVFHRADLRISDKMTAKDVPGWDSLNHVILMVAIEKEFKIRFSTLELLKLQSVGDLLLLIAQKALNRSEKL